MGHKTKQSEVSARWGGKAKDAPSVSYRSYVLHFSFAYQVLLKRVSAYVIKPQNTHPTTLTSRELWCPPWSEAHILYFFHPTLGHWNVEITTSLDSVYRAAASGTKVQEEVVHDYLCKFERNGHIPARLNGFKW